MIQTNPRTSLAIQTSGLRVDYADVTAVRELDLEIERGEVFGLIGPNGSGKTSTIRVLATLMEPTHGDVRIGGFDIAESPAEARRITGYMPDLAPVYADLRCWELLDLFAGSYGVDPRRRRLRVDECIEAVGLESKRDAMAGTLSRGMKQRLILAKTILPDPDVLLLDEPASGLDPLARIQMRDLLARLSAEGKTILISSHILSELSGFCTSIGIMQRGEMITCGSIDSVVEGMKRGRRIEVRLTGEAENVEARLASYEGVSDVQTKGDAFEFDLAGDTNAARDLLAAMVRDGLPVCGFTERKVSMEDILIHVGASEVS